MRRQTQRGEFRGRITDWHSWAVGEVQMIQPFHCRTIMEPSVPLIPSYESMQMHPIHSPSHLGPQNPKGQDRPQQA